MGPESSGGEGEGAGEGGAAIWHSAGIDQNRLIGLSELLRLVQFHNSEGYHCDALGEDDNAPGFGDEICTAHDSDYAPTDWQIALEELLRLIQFFNSGGYHPCAEGEDSFCPGPT